MLLCVLLISTVSASAAVDGDQTKTDALYLPGVTIPIADISIERIAAGQVIYRDGRGRRHQRNMDDIGSLRFAGLPQLDRAEELAERGEHREAIPHFLQALVHADNDTQRLWIHARLARAHDIYGEYAQSASHAAAVFLLEQHIVWRDLEPIREPQGEAPFTAVAEARHMLREAQRRVTHRDLSQAITRMSQRIEQMHDQMKDAYDGPAVEPRNTWSGIPIERIRAGEFAAQANNEEPREPEHVAVPAMPDAPPTPAPRVPRDESGAAPEADAAEAQPDERVDGRSAEAIERMLQEHRYADALERCRQIERNLGERDVARFLYQYGRALAGTEEREDAAIMFTRCAILHPSSEYAPLALIETAIIYRDHYDQPRTMLRLLDRAERMLADDAPQEVRDRIARLRER